MSKYFEVLPDPPLLESDILLDYADFSGMSVDDILQRIASSEENAALEYRILGPSKFYTNSDSYIFTALGGNMSTDVRANLMNKFIPRCVENINKHRGNKFLEFRGGVGAVASIVSRSSSKQVTYANIASSVTDFFRFRSKKHSESTNIITVSDGPNIFLPELYDVIYADSVLSVVDPNYQLGYVDLIVSYLNPNGIFMLLDDLWGKRDTRPMYFGVNIQMLHEQLKCNGMECVFGLNNFASVWYKPI
jgi:hypothetical protein